MNNEDEQNNLQGAEPGLGLDEGEDSVTLESGRPAVAAAPGKILLFLVVGAIFIAIVVRSLFFPGEGPVENKIAKPPERVTSAGPLSSSNITPGALPTPSAAEPDVGIYSSRTSTNYNSENTGTLPDLGKFPPPPGPNTGSTLPGLTAPPVVIPGGLNSPTLVSPSPILSPTMPSLTAPPVTTGTGAIIPPAPPPIAAPALPDVKTSLPRDEATMKRNQADIISYKGGATPTPPPARAQASFSGTDSNSQFANTAMAADHSANATAEKLINLDYTIVQGKIVDCVLETAINSDLPGTIRAIVSHDVYAEAGRQIMIPKGSRMIGTYNAGVKKGQGRVFIIWTRLIRPDGVTIDIDSPGIDPLGRAGVAGDVDNKYFEMFSSAILTSSLDLGVAAVGEALFGNDQTTTTNNGSGSTTTSSPTAEAMRQAVDTIGSVGKTIVNNTVGFSPTITIDQGTKVNVFVNKELIFPPSVTSREIYLQ